MSWTNEQEKAINKTGNLLISASAGSGKTTVMIEKVFQMLLSGQTDIRRIVVLTFTNASALEMKEKLLNKLNSEIIGCPKADLLRTQIDNIPFSYVCTIDSFCKRLATEFFEVLEISPSLKVLETAESEFLISKAIDDTIEDFIDKNDAEFNRLTLIFTQKSNLDLLKSTIKDIINFLSVQSDFEGFAKTIVEISDTNIDENIICDYIKNHYIKYTASLTHDAEILEKELMLCNLPKCTEAVSIMRKNLEKILTSKTIKDLSYYCGFLEKISLILKTSPKKSENENNAVEKYKCVKTQYNYWVDMMKATFISYVELVKILDVGVFSVKKLLEISVVAKTTFSKYKADLNSADFNDLEHFALKVLSDEQRQKEISSRFDYVFIDEYQDTNYLQESIISKIISSDNAFMVGDTKQSIYYFRYAEPKIFLDRFEVYKVGKGENIFFNKNFRSDERILKFVNEVFSEIMTYDFGGLDYELTAKLSTDIPFPIVSDVPAVTVALFKKETINDDVVMPTVYSVKDAEITTTGLSTESEFVAGQIQSLVGKHFIYDSKLKAKRIVKYSDIAILMYKKQPNSFIDSLSIRDIPFNLGGFEVKNFDMCIENIISLLQTIDNPYSDIPLCATLLSPFGKFNDYELLEIRKTCNSLALWESLLAYSGNLKAKIDTFLLAIEKLKALSHFLSVCQLLRTAIKLFSYDKHLLKIGKDAVFNVNNFIYSITDKDYAQNLSEFLYFYKIRGRGDNSSAPDSEDSISFLTVHGSKGLEFPIVFLVNTHNGLSNKQIADKNVFFDSRFGIACRCLNSDTMVKSDTIFTSAFKLKNTIDEKENLMRLFYVALTRAKNHLFITGKCSSVQSQPSDAVSFADWLTYIKQNLPEFSKYFTHENAGFQLPIANNDKPFLSHINPKIAENIANLNFRYKYEASTLIPTKMTVTSLLNKEKTLLVHEDSTIISKKLEEELSFENLSETFKSAKSKKEMIVRGVFYHKVLELIPIDIISGDLIRDFVKNIIKNQPEFEGQDIEQSVIVIQKIMETEIFQSARNAEMVLREQTFMIHEKSENLGFHGNGDRILIQGTIDMLILGNETILVDYKFSQKRDQNLTKFYKTQLQSYANAVKLSLNKDVDKAYIISLVNGNIIKIW